MIIQRGLEPSDRARLESLLATITAFTDQERAVALELVDARLNHPESDDYRFILALTGEEAGGGESRELAGYLCYGRTPMTDCAYDLYWLATAPAFARTGVARALVASMEAEVAKAEGGVVRVETGSREGHGAAVSFYDALGYARAATIADFYAPGDDLILFTRRIAPPAGTTIESPRPPTAMGAATAEGLDEATLFDAAFGYRDYDKEREFLLACARRFGSRDVKRVLAWASGSGRHLHAFADAGIGGVGVEASPLLVAFAERLSRGRAAVPEIAFLRCALDAPPPVRDFDLSFVALSSIHLLGSEEALKRHLSAAAGALAPGGLHVIEATHPSDLTPNGVSHTEWTEVRGELVIDARFRIHTERLTAPSGTVPVTLEVVCTTGKKGATRGRLKQEDRWFIPDMATWRRVVAGVPELEFCAALGDFHVDVPFEHSAAWRLILVLKRR